MQTVKLWCYWMEEDGHCRVWLLPHGPMIANEKAAKAYTTDADPVKLAFFLERFAAGKANGPLADLESLVGLALVRAQAKCPDALILARFEVGKPKA